MINGLHHEEYGAGDAILCIHGTGSSTLGWRAAAAELARRGRVIAYDRRGCGRSERPDPYERTSVAEHSDDAARLLDALGAAPAVVVGRSYGATIALDLALRHPGRVRALALLEGDAPREMTPAAARWVDDLGDRLRAVAARDGVDAVGESFIEAVAGPGAWETLPADFRRAVTGNGPAILAELNGAWWLPADAAALATLRVPVLLVAATGSPPALREPTEALAAALPGALMVTVGGGHLIDPASPAVLEFIDEALGGSRPPARGGPTRRTRARARPAGSRTP